MKLKRKEDLAELKQLMKLDAQGPMATKKFLEDKNLGADMGMGGDDKMDTD